MGDVAANLAPGFWKTADAAVDYPQAGESNLIEAILAERAWEFVAELGGNRWLDLIRTEKVAEATALRDNREVSLIGNPSDQTRWRSPIPSTEIEFNPNLGL